MRIGLGLLFLLPGIDKFRMGAEGFSGMLEMMLGMTGGMAVTAAWLVILFEILGGLALILGKMVPKNVYRVSVLGLLVISVVALLGVHLPTAMGEWGGMNTVMLMFQLLATLGLVGLWYTKPMCPCGMTGCTDGQCKM